MTARAFDAPAEREQVGELDIDGEVVRIERPLHSVGVDVVLRPELPAAAGLRAVEAAEALGWRVCEPPPGSAADDDGTMTATQRDRHLGALRERHAMTDDEFLRRYEAGEVHEDVDAHAWLIMLGRGDLIGGVCP